MINGPRNDLLLSQFNDNLKFNSGIVIRGYLKKNVSLIILVYIPMHLNLVLHLIYATFRLMKQTFVKTIKTIDLILSQFRGFLIILYYFKQS